jgi:hypothetical protein
MITKNEAGSQAMQNDHLPYRDNFNGDMIPAEAWMPNPKPAQDAHQTRIETMKSMTTMTAIVLAALASVPALASEGDYYEGVARQQLAPSTVDRSFGYTGSISGASAKVGRQEMPTINSGDYFEGAVRPN